MKVMSLTAGPQWKELGSLECAACRLQLSVQPQLTVAASLFIKPGSNLKVIRCQKVPTVKVVWFHKFAIKVNWLLPAKCTSSQFVQQKSVDKKNRNNNNYQCQKK